MSFDCIVAADKQWGIGKDNQLPWPRLRGDMDFFKKLTSGAPASITNAIIMGRNTYDSIGYGLPFRYNVVVSSRLLQMSKLVESKVPRWSLRATSLSEALESLERQSNIDQVFVIGGAQLYKEAFRHPMCHSVYLTKIDHVFDCDTRIDPVDDLFPVSEPVVGLENEIQEGPFRYSIARRLRT